MEKLKIKGQKKTYFRNTNQNKASVLSKQTLREKVLLGIEWVTF